jgi:hypothetical protein
MIPQNHPLDFLKTQYINIIEHIGATAERAWLQAPLQKTAAFAACLDQNFGHVERRDALVFPLLDSVEAPNNALRGCIVSLHKIEPRHAADFKCSLACPIDIGKTAAAAILLFPDADAVYRYTEGKRAAVTVKCGETVHVTTKDKYVIFVQDIKEGNILDENDNQRSAFEEIVEIPAKRARDVFYGRARSTRQSLETLHEWQSSVVKEWGEEDVRWTRDTLETWGGETCVWSREDLRGRRMMEQSDDQENGELISSARAAAIFSGRARPNAANRRVILNLLQSKAGSLKHE